MNSSVLNVKAWTMEIQAQTPIQKGFMFAVVEVQKVKTKCMFQNLLKDIASLAFIPCMFGE